MTMADSFAPPKIYLGRWRASDVSSLGRLASLGLALGCLSLLITAASLTPSPDGLGTHRQMGMPQCGWLIRMGLPCPACGMTTSFAWFARGNLAASIYVQPMGMVLALICGLCMWGAGYIALTGKPIHRVFSRIPEKYYLIPLLSLAIIAWGWKMYIHLHGIDGWK